MTYQCHLTMQTAVKVAGMLMEKMGCMLYRSRKCKPEVKAAKDLSCQSKDKLLHSC